MKLQENNVQNNLILSDNSSDYNLKSSNNDEISVATNSNLKSSGTYTVNEKTYSTYFTNDGYLQSNVNQDSILDLNGNFNNKTFILTKPLTLTSSNNNAVLTDCYIIINPTANGSTISNLKITDNQIGAQAITFNASSHNTVVNNYVNCSKEHGGITIVFQPGSTYNLVENNILVANYTSWDYFHEVIVLFASDYNTIQFNTIHFGDDNGIYLSTYGRSNGVKSNYNKIIGNNLICDYENPSPWSYCIQVMGDNNQVINNTVNGGYRGISTTGGNNNIVTGNTLNGISGDCAIYGCDICTIYNNTISKSLASTGIWALSNSNIYNNTVCMLKDGKGISIIGSNINITNNKINTVSGEGIYTMGSYSNILIDSNNITSNGSASAVSINKQSSTKYPKSITVTRNTINTNGSVAINAKETDDSTLIFNNTFINSNTINYPTISTKNSTDNNSKFNNTFIYIDNSNFNKYFTNTGEIITGALIDGNSIIFNDTFYNKSLLINLRLKILGLDATFYNSTFKITQSGCDIEGLNIINNNPNGVDQWPIYVTGANNVKIIGNYLNVTDKEAAYAIYLFDSGNDIITNNVLVSHGNYLTYTLLTYSVSGSVIANNTITTTGTGVLYNFTKEACIDGLHNVVEIYETYGILLLYSSNNNVSDNNVSVNSDLTYTPNTTQSSNSLVGIDIYYDSHNNTVNNNNIIINAYDPYLYGAGVLGAQTGVGTSTALNNNFTKNNININGTYCVNGLIIGYNSYNTTLLDNIVKINGKGFAYGINLEESTNSVVKNNNINTNALINYVMELYLSNGNLICGNNLTGEGTYAYGIGAIGSNNTIQSNQIIANGFENNSSLKIASHSDSIPYGNSGIFLYTGSNTNTITNNIINTNAVYAVNSTTSSNTVVGNGLKSANYTGDAAVNPQSSLVHDNYGVSTNVSTVLVLNGLSENYGAGDNLTGKLTDSNGNVLVGQHIALNLTNPRNSLSKVYWVTTDTNGEFQLQINLYIGTYTASASYAGSKINNITYTGSNSDTVSIQVLNVSDNRTSTVLTANKFNQKVGAGQNFTGILKDNLGKLLIGQHIALNLTRLSNGQSKVYWVTTDTDGAFQLAINLGIGEYSAKCSYTGTSTYQPSTASNTITVTA